MYSLVLNNIIENLQFAHIENKGNTLIGIGKSITSITKTVLQQSKKPLHYTEIHNRVENLSNNKVDIRRIKSILFSLPGVRLFAKGTYGTKHHLKHTDEDRITITSAVLDIFNNGHPEKQWHSTELLQEMIENGYDIPNNISPYELSIILDDSKDFIYLGRNVWIAKYQGKNTNNNRILINDAMARILKDAGGPITDRELRNKLSNYRGVCANFQINSDALKIRLSHNTWGLVKRDIPISSSIITEALNILFFYLKASQKAIHISEIKSLITKKGIIYPKSLDSYVFLGLCSNDNRFKTWPGQLIGLSTWNSPNRINFSNAFKKAYQNMKSSFTLDEILKSVEFFLERKVDKRQVGIALSNTEAFYNKNDHVWEKGNNIEGETLDEYLNTFTDIADNN